MHTSSRYLLISAGIALLTTPCLAADPTSPADILRPYLDNQTFLVARVDARQLPLPELVDRATKVLKEMVDDPDIQKNMESGTGQLVGLRDSFVQAGGKEIFVVLSLADLPYREPFLVITSSSPEDLDVLQGLVRQLTGGRMEARKAAPTACWPAKPPRWTACKRWTLLTARRLPPPGRPHAQVPYRSCWHPVPINTGHWPRRFPPTLDPGRT